MKHQSKAQLNALYNNVNDDFRPKKAYENPSENRTNYVLSVIFNILSACLFASLAFSFRFDFAEKIGAGVALLVIAAAVELSKRAFGKKYKSFLLAHDDEDLTEQQQTDFLQKSNKNGRVFIGFVIFSIIVATYAGSQNAYLFGVESVIEQKADEKQYDASIYAAVELAKSNHQAALKSDKNDIGSHKAALKAYNLAAKDWKNHKSEIEKSNLTAKEKTKNENEGLKKEGHNEGLKYAVLFAIISIIVEFFSIFYLFQYVECGFEILQDFKKDAIINNVQEAAQTVTLKNQSQNVQIAIEKQSASFDDEADLLRRLAKIQESKK